MSKYPDEDKITKGLRDKRKETFGVMLLIAGFLSLISILFIYMILQIPNYINKLLVLGGF